MNSDDCFLEAHYYSAGLRHRDYATSSRPFWAPDADAVGFRDEFELNNDDAAVEVRRFQIGEDKVSWLGVYYRSVDAKLGDRSNHAGVGAWFRNAVPGDVQQLLHGLALLARQISADIDPEQLSPNAARFLSPHFLPSYAIPIESLEPAQSFAFAPPGIVDTKVLTVGSDEGVGKCRALADYLVELFWLERDRVAPRALFHVSRSFREEADIAPDYEVSPKILMAISKMREVDQARIRQAEAALSAAREKAEALAVEVEGLRSQAAELHDLRDDPMRVMTRRLDEIAEGVRSLESKAISPPPTQSTMHWPAVRRSAVSPVQRGSTTRVEEETFGVDWVTILLLVLLIATVGTLLFVAGDWLVNTYARR